MILGLFLFIFIYKMLSIINTVAIQTLLYIPSSHLGLEMHICVWSSLVQVMAWRLFGAKLLPEPMMIYYQLDPPEQTLVKSEYKKNH